MARNSRLPPIREDFRGEHVRLGDGTRTRRAHHDPLAIKAEAAFREWIITLPKAQRRGLSRGLPPDNFMRLRNYRTGGNE